MDRKKQIERKKQIQRIIRYIEGQKKNGHGTKELQELKNSWNWINSFIDYSSTSSINPRGSWDNVSSSSSSSNVNSYFNINDDDDEENDFQDFFDSMADPEFANLNKIQMFKNFDLFVIAKSKFIIIVISNNLYINIIILYYITLYYITF